MNQIDSAEAMKISVIMPAYNAERFLAEAIESVLAQTWKMFELIILDDGSQDRTREIAESYSQRDTRIRVVSHPNMGIAPALNNGLALAVGEWVAVMHADDVMMPNRIERQIAFVTEHPELAVASSWVKHIDAEGKIIANGRSNLLTHEAVQKLYLANELIGICHPAAILRKRAVQAAGGYRGQFRVNEDCDLWNRLLEFDCKILVQPEFLLKYRIHPASASIASARLVRRQMHWVRDCMLRRRRGQAELSWEEYLCFRRKLPWYIRANQERKNMAKVFYKTATYYYAGRKYFSLVPVILMAMLLQPSYSIRQVLVKLVIRNDE